MVRGLPTKIAVRSSEIIEACSEQSEQIIDLIKLALETIPPELAADISEDGIILTGGGSRIYGMEMLIFSKTGVMATLIDNPELTVAKGAGTAKKYIREKTSDDE
jgi:rod shape-determining protein MreB